MKTKPVQIIKIFLFIFLLQSCNSGKYSISPGPSESGANGTVSAENVEQGKRDATLIISEHNQPDTIIGIEQIDHERFSGAGYKNRTEYELAPGRHTVFYHFIRRRYASVISAADLNISFSAKAGHLYELKNYARWDDETDEKVGPVDSLTMVIDTTEGEVVAWESRGTGDFKEEVQQSKTGLNKLTEEMEKNADKTGGAGLNSLATGYESVFLDFAYRSNEYGNYKAVFLDFVYKGNKYGIYFIVSRIVHKKLASLPRLLSYKKEKEEIKKDFILPKLNNQLQKEKLLPLVEKIRSLTPDVNKQARIAISMVQNIPYGFPTDSNSEINYEKKYPYGVIWEQKGICDEKSDLLLFLLRELGFGTATLIYKKEYHRAVGIKCPDAYDVDDSGYCYVEVTGPKIITDNLSRDTGVGTLTDYTLIKISDGIQLEGVEEEFTDRNLYYNLIFKAKAKNGVMEQDEYKLYNSILNKYGME